MESKNEWMNTNFQFPPAKDPVTPPSSQNLRQWRPAAQRNLKNQWLKLASLWKDWLSSSPTARSNATALVNSYLSQRYMDGMEFGVLSEMPEIRKKACLKLYKQQVINKGQLLSSYKTLVGIVIQMVNASRSMRCYRKGMSSSPIIQFTCSPPADNNHLNDTDGDGGGVPVFTFLPVSSFEQMAEELVRMLESEINLKRLLVMELFSISDKDNYMDWSEELYPGEFDDLIKCGLYTNEPIFPSHTNCTSNLPANSFNEQADRNILQVYLTIWLVEVKIDRLRIDEIFSIVGEEMHINLN